jgi:TatD DNase family protein
VSAELFDTHCHLQDAQYKGDAADVVQRAAAAGVSRMLACAYDRDSVAPTLELADRFDAVLAAVGIHPHDAHQVNDATIDLVRFAASHPRCVAIGEIGLDYYRDLQPRPVQLGALQRQLDLAVELGLPVSIHSRSAEQAIEAPLAQYASRSPLRRAGRPAGVMHCFAGSLEQARRFVALGFLISIPCTITYPNAESTRELARALPLEVLVVETDAPYLPPQTSRGKRNEPAFVVEAVRAIAAAREMPVEVAIQATTENAARAFAIPVAAGVER